MPDNPSVDGTLGCRLYDTELRVVTRYHECKYTDIVYALTTPDVPHVIHTDGIFEKNSTFFLDSQFDFRFWTCQKCPFYKSQFQIPKKTLIFATLTIMVWLIFHDFQLMVSKVFSKEVKNKVLRVYIINGCQPKSTFFTIVLTVNILPVTNRIGIAISRPKNMVRCFCQRIVNKKSTFRTLLASSRNSHVHVVNFTLIDLGSGGIARSVSHQMTTSWLAHHQNQMLKHWLTSFKR